MRAYLSKRGLNRRLRKELAPFLRFSGRPLRLSFRGRENNPLSRIDSFGTCDLIVAGSGESEDTVGGRAIIDYASTIGANVVFPYAGLSVEASVADIIAQGNGDTTPATVATANGYSATYWDGLLNGTGFGATAFSGGAQALTSAQAVTGLLAPDEINYVSPGMGGFQRSPLKGFLHVDSLSFHLVQILPVTSAFLFSTCNSFRIGSLFSLYFQKM